MCSTNQLTCPTLKQEITNLVTECLPTSPSLSSSSSHPPPNYSQYQQNLGKSFKTLLRNKQPEIFELGWEEIRAREEESISNDEQVNLCLKDIGILVYKFTYVNLLIYVKMRTVSFFARSSHTTISMEIS